MKSIIILLLTVLSFNACKPTVTPTAVIPSPTDSLMNVWNKAWSDHDSTAIRSLFDADAIVTDDDIVAKNPDEISTKWIGPYHNLTNNMTTEKLQEWASIDRAGYTGTYEFTLNQKDTVVIKPKGIITLNWKKSDKGDWKVTTAHIHELKK